jgi:hypothetical protein
MADDVIPELCAPALTRSFCDPETCPRVHLSQFELTKSSVHALADIFELQALAKSDRVKVNSTKREQKLLRGPKPVLCWVCLSLIRPHRDLYFPCCDVFSCASCAAQWRFPGCCPACGQGAGVEARPGKCDTVSRLNTGVLSGDRSC